MRWALVVFYASTWQVEAFTATNAMCRQLAEEVQLIAEDPKPWACIPIARDPVYYSR